MKNVAEIKSNLQDDKEAAEVEIATWQEKFAANPIYGMEWSDNTFYQAAVLEHAISYLDVFAYATANAVEDDILQAEIYKTAQKSLLRLATQNTNKSTGQGRNMLNQARVEVAAKFFEWLNQRW